MKIEVKIHNPFGEVKVYPVHKLVRQDVGWELYYTTIKNGRHITKTVHLTESEEHLLFEVNE